MPPLNFLRKRKERKLKEQAEAEAEAILAIEESHDVEEEEEERDPYALPEPLTFIYKSLPLIHLHADIYLPPSLNISPIFPVLNPAITIGSPSNPLPVLLFIHGGTWIYGSRKEFPRATFFAFLERDYLVVSIDYRLLPESEFVKGQLKDLKDVETWMRLVLPEMMREEMRVEVDVEKIIILGVGSGAHLALLTPKIWTKPPVCILSMYGPTNLLSLVPVKKGPFKDFTIPKITARMLEKSRLNPPPTSTPPLKPLSQGQDLRFLIGLAVMRNNIVGEFLIGGLNNGLLPEAGSVDEDEIKAISPFHITETTRYPAVFQVIGSEDEAFHSEQVVSFDRKLKENGVVSQMIVVEGLGHSFDMKSVVRDATYYSVLLPLVDFADIFVQHY